MQQIIETNFLVKSIESPVNAPHIKNITLYSKEIDTELDIQIDTTIYTAVVPYNRLIGNELSLRVIKKHISSYGVKYVDSQETMDDIIDYLECL